MESVSYIPHRHTHADVWSHLHIQGLLSDSNYSVYKMTGKDCSVLPIVSDVVDESHKGTNTNGISPENVMRRTEVSQNSISHT